MRSNVGFALVIMATACAPMAQDAVPEVGVSAYRCDAAGINDLVGRTATVELGAEALRRSGSRHLRWIRPGDVVTMDYRPDRLNVRLDFQNRVDGFTCG